MCFHYKNVNVSYVSYKKYKKENKMNLSEGSLRAKGGTDEYKRQIFLGAV